MSLVKEPEKFIDRANKEVIFIMKSSINFFNRR